MVLPKTMPSIVGKQIKGRTYYYLVESARVNGKPRIVSQQYLGTTEEVMGRLGEGAGGEPDATRHLSFGNIAAIWNMLLRIGVIDIIDAAVGSRRSDAAASVGTYIALACLNRVVSPCSKLGFARWWETTVGPRLLHIPQEALDHHYFWKAMDAITPEQLVVIERKIAERMVAAFSIDLSGLVLDMTNFATYIDSANPRAPIAKRGHAKQKRTDLRLVGLGLVVSTDGAVPLVSQAYAGDKPDVTQFPDVISELAKRFGALAATTGDLTVVYDAGQDSQDNQELIHTSPLHFVGSLPPSDRPELLAIPMTRYRMVDAARFPGLRAFETRATALGREYRVVVTHSATLAAKQQQGFDQTLAGVGRKLADVAARLERGHGRKGREAVEKEIATITSPRWVNRVLTTTLAGTGPQSLNLSWTVNTTARDTLETEIFGKRILFTDRETWTTAQVVAAYRSQSEVEADFRQMKDAHVVSFSPMYHWTDQKIRVHAFYCVLALAVARLMQREVSRTGLNMSVREMLHTLGGIEETVMLYHGETGRPRARRMLTEMSSPQKHLFDLFELQALAPKR